MPNLDVAIRLNNPMLFFKKHLLLICLLICGCPAFAQNDSIPQEKDKLTIDSIAGLNKKKKTYIDTVAAKNALKKKKVKKKVFYGLKTRRGFAKKGTGKRMEVEFFYTPKKWKDPNPYAKEIYVFDMRKQQVLKVDVIDPKKKMNYLLMHGPYKKMQGDKILEEGIFFVGTKHGRWELYDKDFTLLDKTKYYKGWPRDSKLSFYDGAQTKLKEVLPYEFGKRNGDYYLFKENEEILIQGQYKDDMKAGIWTEYYPDVKQKKTETHYPKDPLNDKTKAFVFREWDEKGNLIMENGKKVEVKQKIQPKKKPVVKKPPVKPPVTKPPVKKPTVKK
jgi:antitoxin component YwqK of YwqJK toxin-antitoxin module